MKVLTGQASAGIALLHPPLDAAGHMALDEAVLAEPPAAPVLRVYRWEPRGRPSATFGLLQPRAEAVAELERRGHAGADLVRRPTGGGLVLHDRDVTFSLVLRWPRLGSAQRLYEEVHRGVLHGLRAAGVPVRIWSSAGGAPVRSPACFPDPSPADLTLADGRKCLGGALRRAKSFALYQGSLRPEGLSSRPAALASAILAGLSGLAGGVFRAVRVPGRLLDRARDLRDGKYLTEAWNRRR